MNKNKKFSKKLYWVILLLSLYSPFSSTAYTKVPTQNSNRIDSEYVSQVGTLYSGYKMAKRNFENFNSVFLLGFPPLLLITLPLTSFDIIGSLVLDTLFLPIDLLCEDKEEWKSPRCKELSFR